MAFSLVPSKDSSASLDTLLFGLFVALLLWIPIPLGSNRPWAWAILEIGAYSLLAAVLLSWAMGVLTLPRVLERAWLACTLLAAWVALQAVQVVPLPASWVAFLSPQAARVHSLTEVLGSVPATMTLSQDPSASMASLLRTLAYASVFVLALVLVDSRRRVRLLASVLVYSALAHAVFAVLMHLWEIRLDFFGTRIAHETAASGTYPNRNHFAGYLEMTLALGIGLLIAGLTDRRADSWKKLARHALEWVLSPKMVLRLALCVLVIALTTTHSRMGNTAFFAALLVAGGVGIALSRNATRNTVVLLTSLVIIDLLIVGSWFGVERLAQRLQQTTVQELQQREDPAAHTLAMIRDYPVFGAGAGTFHIAFEAYRPEAVVDYYDYAHNDYAQFASESGLLGIAIIGLFVALSLGAAIRAQWSRRDPLMRGMSFASMMGVTAILIHSAFDFNLQIPANAAYFMVLLALAWISLYHDRSHSTPPE